VVPAKIEASPVKPVVKEAIKKAEVSKSTVAKASVKQEKPAPQVKSKPEAPKVKKVDNVGKTSVPAAKSASKLTTVS